MMEMEEREGELGNRMIVRTIGCRTRSISIRENIELLTTKNLLDTVSKQCLAY